MLRAGADQSGERDMLRQLRHRDSCVELLRLLGSSSGSSPEVGRAAADEAQGAGATSIVKESDFQPLRVLTWNIAGDQVSASGPAWWTGADKVAAMRQEVARWDPDVVALQECPGQDRWGGLDDSLELVGVASAHAGFVHLYVKRGLPSERVSAPARCPCVVAEVKLRGGTVQVASAHLAPGLGAAAVRLEQVRQISKTCSAGSVVLLGDLNVREEEMEELREVKGVLGSGVRGQVLGPPPKRILR